MKKIIILFVTIALFSCKSNKVNIETIVAFKGQQVTGVSVSDKGRMFANFPRWRAGVENSVVEVLHNGESIPFPNQKWNSWKLETPTSDSVFVAIQSVVAFENMLYVLDTRNPLFNGVIENPRVFAFDLNTNQLKKTFQLNEASFHKDSYINDLRVDKKNGKMYLTDSGHAGLVVLDMNSGKSVRVLDNHKSTLAEVNQLTFDNGVWNNTVHSDGIALDTQNDILYFHALTGYDLYAIATDKLISNNLQEIEESVKFVSKTAAPDGMIMGNTGNLFYADLENNSINKLNLSNGKISVVAKGKQIRWADSFSIYDNTLYYTNSRINEAQNDISKMEFSINKIKLK